LRPEPQNDLISEPLDKKIPCESKAATRKVLLRCVDTSSRSSDRSACVGVGIVMIQGCCNHLQPIFQIVRVVSARIYMIRTTSGRSIYYVSAHAASSLISSCIETRIIYNVSLLHTHLIESSSTPLYVCDVRDSTRSKIHKIQMLLDSTLSLKLSLPMLSQEHVILLPIHFGSKLFKQSDSVS
jgi:hypothetical protein